MGMTNTKVVFKDAGNVFTILEVPADAGVAASRRLGRAIIDWMTDADDDATFEIHTGAELVARVGCEFHGDETNPFFCLNCGRTINAEAN